MTEDKPAPEMTLAEITQTAAQGHSLYDYPGAVDSIARDLVRALEYALARIDELTKARDQYRKQFETTLKIKDHVVTHHATRREQLLATIQELIPGVEAISASHRSKSRGDDRADQLADHWADIANRAKHVISPGVVREGRV